MLKKIETRKCLFSGEEFYPKRNNQVFASKQNRTTYHNNISNSLRNELKSTNNQLMKNYKIVKQLLSDKNSIII